MKISLMKIFCLKKKKTKACVELSPCLRLAGFESFGSAAFIFIVLFLLDLACDGAKAAKTYDVGQGQSSLCVAPELLPACSLCIIRSQSRNEAD